MGDEKTPTPLGNGGCGSSIVMANELRKPIGGTTSLELKQISWQNSVSFLLSCPGPLDGVRRSRGGSSLGFDYWMEVIIAQMRVMDICWCCYPSSVEFMQDTLCVVFTSRMQ